MRKITTILVMLILLLAQDALGQSNGLERKIKKLKEQREKVEDQEKKALKQEVKDINARFDNGTISFEKAQELKEAAAKKRALNIENRISIIDNRIALLERNEDLSIDEPIEEDTNAVIINLTDNDDEDYRILGIRFRDKEWDRPVKYDRRTYSDFVIAIGLNNAIIENQSLDDSPYKIGGSRFFEMGWQWRTRVFRNSNWLRLNYGLSFQFNGLKPVDNQYFVINGDQTDLEEFPLELNKSKLRMDNLVFPIHFEFGPSKYYASEDKIRYSLNRQFRMGIGGYGGFNIGTRQKLKYSENGDDIKDKLKRDYNTSNLIYGLSAYIGFDNTLLYCKYDLNTIFTDNPVEQRNISLGLRFDID
ncbi:hypothetical protein [Croceivirga thetidis]|uniref:Outer membrane protein beta-barrel domain-containing protein n=1 Tax=Croceivirga thetidis TaxID=2721623 RepID=A0ABX1GKP5_9FLAO|nr:hypothetical protein [Croceivirga thetidis]NKI30470.1 hypothetical protein [Croceivirga thetidis]